MSSVNPDQFDLYHFTTPEAAESIKKSGFSGTTGPEKGVTYFTTHPGSEYASSFGNTPVHVRMPVRSEWQEDEFPTGEKTYRVPTSKIRPEHIQ